MNFSKITPQLKAIVGTLAVLGAFAAMVVTIGTKNLWFTTKVLYKTELSEGDGLHVGTLVTLNGLRVGEIEELDVNDQNKIAITFSIVSIHQKKMREDTIIQVKRSMMVGNKKLDIRPGISGAPLSPPGSMIKGQDSLEITDMFSGNRFGTLMDRFDKISGSLLKVADLMSALTKKASVKDVEAVYDLMLPVLRNLNATLYNVKKITRPLAKDHKLVGSTFRSVGKLTNEMASQPDIAKKLVDALQQATLTMKAIQRTWILKSHVEDVQEEKKKKKKNKK